MKDVLQMQGLIDYHAHVIPGIDDGAADADIAVAMLKESRRQGVHTVVATPHFYADRHSPDEWLARRDRHFIMLQEAMKTAELDMRVCAVQRLHISRAFRRQRMRPGLP